MIRFFLFIVLALTLGGSFVHCFLFSNNAATQERCHLSNTRTLFSTLNSPTTPSSPWFTDNDGDNARLPSKEKLKAQILQLGAALDRGQSYNPTSGECK